MGYDKTITPLGFTEIKLDSTMELKKKKIPKQELPDFLDYFGIPVRPVPDDHDFREVAVVGTSIDLDEEIIKIETHYDADDWMVVSGIKYIYMKHNQPIVIRFGAANDWIIDTDFNPKNIFYDKDRHLPVSKYTYHRGSTIIGREMAEKKVQEIDDLLGGHVYLKLQFPSVFVFDTKTDKVINELYRSDNNDGADLYQVLNAIVKSLKISQRTKNHIFNGAGWCLIHDVDKTTCLEENDKMTQIIHKPESDSSAFCGAELGVGHSISTDYTEWNCDDCADKRTLLNKRNNLEQELETLGMKMDEVENSIQSINQELEKYN